ncbi:alpha/beta hydrolase [Streptomyces sp. HNM0575]|uniref:alpha/beta fold hydrolase n=1 Tax=Streptomyces sp. HNM0575 TaxID=2716338 RepID=UPI00145C9DCD|nr:alpha/beta fold hydrolase [Streptomyces sp. HNM0575]NLU72293.1 alpha/beta hydrolase [Streptomyces sp. HNM0575]
MARVAAGAAVPRRALCLLGAVLLAAAVGCSEEPHKAGGPWAGPYEVVTQQVSADDADGGFGDGTVRYPDDGSRDYGVIAASPGLGADESTVAPYGELLASHGFVVITIDTKTPEDSPAQRGRQLLRALDYATERSDAADRADPRRLGVLGHSMGGGGALYAAARNPHIRAAVPLTPYATRRDWHRVEAPTLVVGGSDDEVAPVSEYADAFYEGLSGAREKAYLELKGDHFVATPPDGLVSRQVVAWFGHFLAGAPGSPCPLPSGDGVTESRDTCPFGTRGR